MSPNDRKVYRALKEPCKTLRRAGTGTLPFPFMSPTKSSTGKPGRTRDATPAPGVAPGVASHVLARRESPVARICHPGPGRRSWGRLARPSSTSSARSDRPAHPGSPQAYRARDGPRRCCRRDERVHRRHQGDVRPRPAWHSGSCGARHPAPPRRQLNSRRNMRPNSDGWSDRSTCDPAATTTTCSGAS